ncbi:MAG: pyridoxal phosphate-dependent aminotransferase [Chitinophagales bacterium]
MENLSRRISELHESATIKMAQLARELKTQGKDIISLSLGEPDFDTPQHIKDAAKKAIDDGYTSYPPVPGYTELRQAISEKFKRENKLDYAAEQIVVSTGAKQSLINVVLCLANPGDEIIIPEPYWVSYAAMAQLAEAKMVNISTNIDADFKITAEQLENAITDKSKLFMFSSPCNPTGSVYSRNELAALVEVFKKYPQLYIISDEIYEYINFEAGHESIGTFPEIADRVITVNGFSKGFAMTGWRVGYIGAPLWIAKACTKMQGQYTSGACSIAQKAAEAAIKSGADASKEMKAAFQRRRDMLIELLEAMPGLKVNRPKGAFYIFPDVSAFFGKSYDGEKIKDADDLCMYLLKEANVSLVTGSAFGAPNCLRISYAASEQDLRKAMSLIKDALGKLA